MEIVFEAGREVFMLELSTSPINPKLNVATISASSTSLDCVDLHAYWKGLATTLFEAGAMTGTIPMLADGVDRKPQTRNFYIPVAQQRGTSMISASSVDMDMAGTLSAAEAVSVPNGGISK